ncbi:hypothetical protein MMC28_004867 [Mycoblastus sanguinarius]|nr:hypothetical protein [Mycoblastus sanguinarius]
MGKKRNHNSISQGLEVSKKKRRTSTSVSRFSSNIKPGIAEPRQEEPHPNGRQRSPKKAVVDLLSDTSSDGETSEAHSKSTTTTTTQHHPGRSAQIPSEPKRSAKIVHNLPRPPRKHGVPSLVKALNFPPINPPSGTPATAQQQTQSQKDSPKDRPYNGHSSTLPPLPPVRDPSLSNAAFTHPGVINIHTNSKVDLSYDRLEFLGDAYIELIATRMVYPRFPNLPPGRLSQQRELLVKNETLADYSLAYGFDKKLKLPPSFEAQNTRSKIWTKTLGDVFEAYVAAVIMSDPENGFQIAEAWLTALWESKLSVQKSVDTKLADANAKQQLGQRIMGKGIKLNYKDEAPPDEYRKEGKLVFHIGVYLTGWGWENQHLGSGKGLSKQEAGAHAAVEALANPLTARVMGVKRDFDAKVWLERNVQDGDVVEGGKERKEGGGS